MNLQTQGHKNYSKPSSISIGSMFVLYRLPAGVVHFHLMQIAVNPFLYLRLDIRIAFNQIGSIILKEKEISGDHL